MQMQTMKSWKAYPIVGMKTHTQAENANAYNWLNSGKDDTSAQSGSVLWNTWAETLSVQAAKNNNCYIAVGQILEVYELHTP